MFFVMGCGVFQSISNDSLHIRERVSGEDPLHTRSCGPKAVVEAINYMGIDPHVSHEKISRHIQNNSVLPFRSFLSIFNERARSITFPFEIKRVLEVYNITVKELGSMSDLKEGDVAIILVCKKRSLEYHWICYPVRGNIKSFFGAKDTRVASVFLLENSNDGYFLPKYHFP